MISRVVWTKYFLLKQRVFVLCGGRRSFLSGWFLIFFGANLLMGCGAPRFKDSMTGGTGGDGSTSLSIQIPPGTEEGDLLIAILGIKSNPNTVGPSGWSSVPGFGGFNGTNCLATAGGYACQLSVFYKISNGSETDANFSWGGNFQASAAVLSYSNVNASSPIGAASSRRGASVTPTAPMIRTIQESSRVLRIALSEANDAMMFLNGNLVFGDEPGSLRFNIVSFPDASTDPATGCGPPLSSCSFIQGAVALAASDAPRSTAGPSGTADWTLPAGDQWVTASIEITKP